MTEKRPSLPELTERWRAENDRRAQAAGHPVRRPVPPGELAEVLRQSNAARAERLEPTTPQERATSAAFLTGWHQGFASALASVARLSGDGDGEVVRDVLSHSGLTLDELRQGGVLESDLRPIFHALQPPSLRRMRACVEALDEITSATRRRRGDVP